MNGTEFIAQILKQEGVTEMTCFPSNALIEAAAKKLSQNTLIGEVKFLLPGEKARLRGMFSTAV
ncbi:MAG: hypothetical protein IH867_13735 [Chloroflexi bacterium]|nr:hypothetical protein [Chloroflexota bacterium]